MLQEEMMPKKRLACIDISLQESELEMENRLGSGI